MSSYPTPTPTNLDSVLRPKAAALINRLGMTMLFRELNRGDFVPEESKYGPEQPPDHYEWKGTPPAPWESVVEDGSGLQSGDLVTFLPDFGIQFTPAENMQVVLPPFPSGVIDPDGPGEDIWRIVRLGKVQTGELIGLWEVALRKGAKGG